VGTPTWVAPSRLKPLRGDRLGLDGIFEASARFWVAPKERKYGAEPSEICYIRVDKEASIHLFSNQVQLGVKLVFLTTTRYPLLTIFRGK
jgi:hypothetical protein